MNRVLSTIRLWIALALGAVLAVFAIQNTAQVRLSFLWWDWESRRIVVIALSFFIGVAIGWLVKSHRARSKTRKHVATKGSNESEVES